MPNRYTFVELSDIHYIFGLCDGNAAAARVEYQRRFRNRRLPSAPTFRQVDRRMRDGTVFRNMGAENRVRRPIVERNEERILQEFRRNPRTSTRRVALGLGVTQWTVLRVLHEDGQHPYHFQPVQALIPADSEARLNFAHILLERTLHNPNFITKILWSDESQFTRDGVFNFHNEHVWATQNPKAIRPSHSQHRFHVNVWAGIIGNVLVGPYFIEGNLNGQKYLDFLRNELLNLLDEVPLANRIGMYFQHDGAPPHCTREVREHLNNVFRGRWIGRYGRILWPPRSPDLTPLDFFLWGTMKAHVYAQIINTREQLVEKILEAADIVRGQLRNMDMSAIMRKRLYYCIRADGSHFEHLL